MNAEEKAQAKNPSRGGFSRVWGWKWHAIAVVLVLLLAARLYLPHWVLGYVNRKINETPDYSGSIENVDMHLWRGAYVIRHIAIFKRNGKVPVPLFSAPAIDLALQWKALFHGALVGNIEFERPVINFVKGPSRAQTQVGVDQPWTEQIKKLFPLKINRFHVDGGEVHYQDFFSHPQVNLAVKEIYITASNLTNSTRLSKTEVASLQAEGKPVGAGSAKVDAQFDPYQSAPTFHLKAEVADVPLTRLNELTRAYAWFDFKSGTFAAAAELKAEDGKFNGYVQPVFDHMQIFSLKKDIKNPAKLLWEGLLDSVGHLLRNQPKDRFATRVPLTGTFKDPKEAILSTIGNIFKNAFVQVFNGKVEGGIDLRDVREKQSPPD